MSAPQKQRNVRTKPIPRSTRAITSAFWRSSRTLYFLFSILVFAGLTLLAHRQAPRPDPFQPVQTLSWDWWQYPLERNAFKRLPVITSNLNDVFALPNSEKVWAVGDEGMIVHSEDCGETWVQQEVNWEVVAVRYFTQDSPTRKQQVIGPKQDLNASMLSNLEQSMVHRPLRKKDFDFTQKQVNAPPRTAAFAF